MGWIESVREIITLVQQMDNAELLRRILDLQAEIQDVQAKSIEMQQALAAKDTEIQRLQKTIAFSKRLVRCQDFYFEIDEDGKPFGRAYCPKCWEVDKVAVHVNIVPFHGESTCPNCKSGFSIYVDYSPPANER